MPMPCGKSSPPSLRKPVPAGNIMIHCTHTHSGPNTGKMTGWGEEDVPYMEILPGRIAKACISASEHLEPVEVRHAVVRCEGVDLTANMTRMRLRLKMCSAPTGVRQNPNLRTLKLKSSNSFQNQARHDRIHGVFRLSSCRVLPTDPLHPRRLLRCRNEQS
jgi:hypothetical protein